MEAQRGEYKDFTTKVKFIEWFNTNTGTFTVNKNGLVWHWSTFCVWYVKYTTGYCSHKRVICKKNEKRVRVVTRLKHTTRTKDTMSDSEQSQHMTGSLDNLDKYVTGNVYNVNIFSSYCNKNKPRVLVFIWEPKMRASIFTWSRYDTNLFNFLQKPL